MNELLISAIKKGDFLVARKELENIFPEDLTSLLLDIANDDYNFCAYAFLSFMQLNANDENIIAINSDAFTVLVFGFQYLEGAYQAAAHHIRINFELSLPCNPIKGEMLLFLYIYPERPVSTEEALDVANKILEQYPINRAALEALKIAAERKEDPIALPRNERERLEQLILAGKFSQTKQLLSSVSTRELHAIILYLGCEERNLCAYAFCWYLMQEKEQADLHYLAYRIVTQAFSMKINGCDAAGLFHIKRAMALEPDNEKYIEHFLMLHTPPMGPTPLISDEEVVIVATQAFKKHQCTVFGSRVLKKLGKYDSKYD